jgi:hypothetical protein
VGNYVDPVVFESLEIELIFLCLPIKDTVTMNASTRANLFQNFESLIITCNEYFLPNILLNTLSVSRYLILKIFSSS